MVEHWARSEPSGLASRSFKDVRITYSGPVRRYAVRARILDVLQSVLGPGVPARIGYMNEGVARLGPDELFVLRAEEARLVLPTGQPISVTDVSERSIGLILEGTRAVETLSAGCPLDLYHLAVGRCTRTIYETVEIIVMRESHERLRVEVWRSFAPWLWLALCTVAAAH